MRWLILVRRGLSAAAIGMFIAIAGVLVASFLSWITGFSFLAWAEGLSGPLFLALCAVLVVRHLVVRVVDRRHLDGERRPG